MSITGHSVEIRIEPGGARIEASTELTILEAALLAGLTLPSSCRNGTCRTCLCRLTSGSVTYRIEWPGLSADEKKDGFILPCVAYPASDLVFSASATLNGQASPDDAP